MNPWSTKDSLLAAINDLIWQGHPMLTHPLIDAIASGTATREHLYWFCTQMWAVPKYNLWVAGSKVAQLQPLPPSTMGLGQPYDDKVVQHFSEIFVDEVGNTILPSSPTLGHYEIYLRFSDALGIPREQMEGMDLFLPTTLVACHDWLHMASQLPLIESSIGMNMVNETGLGNGGAKIAQALREHYQLDEDGVMFFVVHGEEDKEHSAIGPYLIEQYANTEEIRHRIWIAARRGYGVWKIIVDAAWEAAEKHLTPLLPMPGMGS